MATTTPTQTQQDQILGAVLAELARGELSDQTIVLVDTIDRKAVPEALRDVVSFIQGMSSEPAMRFHVITSLLREVAGSFRELAEQREENAPPIVY